MNTLLASFIHFNLIFIPCAQNINIEREEMKKRVQPEISYGGVLNNVAPNILPNDTDVQNAVEFALTFVRKRYPKTVPSHQDENNPYRIKDVRKLDVVFTMDGINPYLLNMMSEELQIQSRPLLWGSTYSFKLIWASGTVEYHHSITVTQYWDDSLHIYQHTFITMPKAQNTNTLDLTKIRSPFQQPEIIHPEDISDAVNIEIVESSPKVAQDHAKCDNDNNEQCNGESKTQACDKSGDIFVDRTRKLKVLSFNIWNTNVVQGGYKEYLQRIKQIAKLCRQSEADVIGFQEVRFEDGKGGRQGPNQVKHLATILKEYQFVFQPAQIQTSNLPKRVEEGVAFFSKYPISACDYKLLSRDPTDVADGHQRILLHVEVDMPHIGTVHLFNTHLSLSHVARQRSVKEIWQHMNSFEGPAFLMGDFNAEAHNKEVRYLDGRADINGETTNGLHDVWLMYHGQLDRGFTFSTLEENLTKRIDLIFMRKHSDVTLHNVSILDDGKRRNEAASDHIGLMAIFNMTQRTP